ncbi:hypothetical protein WJX79_005633 [Trebouxia sp. C0005]
MEVKLVGSVRVKHTRTSARAWQRVIPSAEQAAGWQERDTVQGCGCLMLWKRHSSASEPTTGYLLLVDASASVTGAIHQSRRNKASYKHLIQATGATAWTSAAACYTVEIARSHPLDLAVINHATGQRHIVHWDEDEEGKQPLTPTQKSFTRLHSGLVVEKISGTWKWKQVAVSDDGKAILALTSQEGLPSLWLWTSNSFISNNTFELLKRATQGTGYWQHLPTVPKELLSRASALPVDEQQAAETEQTSQQQSLCISLAWMPDGSALVVMDKWGNLALLDVHGTVHRLQQVASPAQQHQQAPETVIGRAAAASRHNLNAKLLPYAVWGPTRQTIAKRPRAFSVSAFCLDADRSPTLAVSDGSYISLWSATPLQDALSIPEPLTACVHPGHHLASSDATLADKAGQQVLPSAGTTLIASPLGVSHGTAKRQDAAACTEDWHLQDGSAVAAASPAVLEHLKQGSVGVHQGDEAAPGGLTLLLFPAPHLHQLGASQPVAALLLNGQQLRKAQQQSSANLWQPDVAAGLLLLCRPESGAAAAFEVLADAEQWQEAVHLGAACLANGCAQQAQLLRLYAGLLQQALALLLDSAAASFAALPVMAVADGRPSEPLNKHLLLHLLGKAILQTAIAHGANPDKPLPINTAYICWHLARQEQLAGLLSMLAGVLGMPSLPSAFMTALTQLGKESAAATLSDLAQELGVALQSQGLLEDKDWEEVKDSLSEPAAFTPDLAQLKHLQHQCDFAAYLRSTFSVLKPHLGLLAADAHWHQQLVDDGPDLSMDEDALPPWSLPSHPSPVASPLHFSSSPEDSKQLTDNGLGTNQAGVSQGAEGLDMSQAASEALKGIIRLGWLLLCRARLSRAWRGNLKHTQQALMAGSFEVSAKEQACAEDLVKWATAVAAANGVHSSKDVQEGVVGACSSIRHPWPAVPQLLEAALPSAPIERAAAMMRRLKAACMDSAPYSTSSDEQGVADWQAEWRAYCSTTMSSLQAWLQSDSDDMAIMQEDIQDSQSNGSAGTEDILGCLLSQPILYEAGHSRLPSLSSCFQHPLCLGTGQGQGLDADGALLALQSLLHPSANPQIRAWQQARVEGIPPQPAPSANSLPAYDTISPADIDLSVYPLMRSQSKAEAAGSLQSSSTAQVEAVQLKDTSNTAGQPLIKAALKTGDLLAPQEGDGTRLGNCDTAGPQLRHVALEQPLAAQSTFGGVASQADVEWTVIQSDGSDTEYNSRSGAKQGLVRVKSALPQEELPQQLQELGLLRTAPSHNSAGVKSLIDDSSQLLKRKLPALKVPLTDALPGQGQYEAGQYADYHSEEGQSEEGPYGEGYFEDTGLDQSLDVLPAGITSAPEVYSPMSCGAARVRSMITNRPFMLEEPTVGDILKMWAPLPKAMIAGEPAQSASQLLRAMRLDRGRPKGRESLTGREQQTRASMGGSPGRLTGQRDQARSANAQNLVSEGSTGSTRLPLNHPHAHGLRLLRLDPRQQQSSRGVYTNARGGDVYAVQERTQAAANQLRLLSPWAVANSPGEGTVPKPQPAENPRTGQSEHQRRNVRSPPHYHEARPPGAPGNSCYDASIRVQRLGHSQQSPHASAEALLGPDHNKGNSQQLKRRQAALQQLAARSRSRSASSSRAVSQQPSRAVLDLAQPVDLSLLNAALDEDAAAARLAGDYLAAVQSAASIHSSASSWPQQVDIPGQGETQQGLQQGSRWGKRQWRYGPGLGGCSEARGGAGSGTHHRPVPTSGGSLPRGEAWTDHRSKRLASGELCRKAAATRLKAKRDGC